MPKKYSIFISYRRRDAGDKAEHLYNLLDLYYKDRISFDRENLTGKFNVQLIDRIDHVKDFIRKRIGIHVLPQKTDQERRLAQFC